MRERFVQIDNMKGILIILVVLGHLLEMDTEYSAISSILHLFIYSFHMPLFVFLSGYLSHKNPPIKRIVCRYLYPFFVFLALYYLFEVKILGIMPEINLWNKYWILWYMLALSVWSLLIRFLKSTPGLILISIIIALLAGYVPNIGYFLSLSRIIVFFPFFLVGHYAEEKRWLEQWKESHFGVHKPLVFFAFLIIILILIYFVINNSNIDSRAFFMSMNYFSTNSNLFLRLLVFIVSGAILILMVRFIPNVPLPFITRFGVVSGTIYLFHGFLIKAIEHFLLPLMEGTKLCKEGLLGFDTICYIMIAFLITTILSRKIVVRSTKFLTDASSFIRN